MKIIFAMLLLGIFLQSCDVTNFSGDSHSTIHNSDKMNESSDASEPDTSAADSQAAENPSPNGSSEQAIPTSTPDSNNPVVPEVTDQTAYECPGTIWPLSCPQSSPNYWPVNERIEFHITTTEQLKKLQADDVDTRNIHIFVLDNDLDFNGEVISPLTRSSQFYFNGGGHKIKNFKIDATSAFSTGSQTGLFSTFSQGCIAHLNLENININDTANLNARIAGGLIGVAGTENVWVMDVQTSGNIVANSSAGGIIGHVGVFGTGGTGEARSAFIDLRSDANVTSTGTSAGGIVGQLYSTRATAIANWFSRGHVNGVQNVGGVAGVFATRNICFPEQTLLSTANVSGQDFVGGLFGTLDSAGGIKSMSFSGIVNGVDSVGGVAGKVVGSIFRAANVTGTIAGDTNVAGIAGFLANPEFGDYRNLSLNATVTGNSKVGALIGGKDPTSTFTYTFLNLLGTVNGQSPATCVVGGANPPNCR